PCPFEKTTKRAETKNQLKSYTRNKQVFFNLAAAMREGVPVELWPAKPEEELLARRMKELWFGKEAGGS
ncbi:MAG: hypothetical protein WAP36_03995, partial [Halanaerobiales bacterium]